MERGSEKGNVLILHRARNLLSPPPPPQKPGAVGQDIDVKPPWSLTLWGGALMVKGRHWDH